MWLEAVVARGEGESCGRRWWWWWELWWRLWKGVRAGVVEGGVKRCWSERQWLEVKAVRVVVGGESGKG